MRCACWWRRCLPNTYSTVPCESDSDEGPTVVGRQADLPPLIPKGSAFPPRKVQDPGIPSPSYILEAGASLHGQHFPPWGKGLGSASAQSAESATELGLSRSQASALEAWVRFPVRGEAASAFVDKPDASAIKQGHVTDCSLMAAFSVLAEYEKKFREPVLSQMIEDQGFGSYACRLFFNGAPREVVVTDTVPVDREGQLLCAHSSRANELWVTLLEKAVATVSGGSYDLRSNPGTDLFHLTGWLPENIPLTGDADQPDVTGDCSGPSVFELDDLFDTACQGFAKGHCVLCLGTSALADVQPDREAERRGYVEGVSASTGLVAGHAYPVLDVRWVGNERLLFLKNPWGRVRWKGRFSPEDEENELAGELGIKSPPDEDDGTFWIEWADVLRHFSHFYLCWNPRSLLLERLEGHGHWQLPLEAQGGLLPGSSELLCFAPQFHLRVRGCFVEEGPGTAVWALLSRHAFPHHAPPSARRQFVTVAIYAGSKRQCGGDALLVQGVYSNGECALVRVPRKVVQGQQDLIFAVTQHASIAPFNFTLQVYSELPGELVALPPVLSEGSYTGAVAGQWTPRTAGGCSNDVWSYFQNPQWCFSVPEEGARSSVVLVLECPSHHTVNLRVFRDRVARPKALRDAESSGEYRKSCCLLRLEELEPGPYVILASTFRPGLSADYRLQWFASTYLEFLPQPHPFASALGHPLKCSVHYVQRTGALSLQLKPGAGAARLSVRLQAAEADRAELPTLAIYKADAGERPWPCDLLKASEADQYFERSGALVIVFTELLPRREYLLEATVPGHYSLKNEAKVYINYQGPLVVTDVTESPDLRPRT